MSNIIVAEDLCKNFTEADTTLEILLNVNLTVRASETIAVVGPSGSGKSTLLHLLGGLDTPTRGEVTLAGANIHQLTERARCALRNKHLGFVYQFHHLLGEFSALENIAMPLYIQGMARETARLKAHEALNDMGLSDRANHLPMQLSGGERQRVAIARAMVTTPACILADEPTGNLDKARAHEVVEQLFRLNEVYKTSLVIVTHDLVLARRMRRVYHLEAGTLYLDTN